MAAHGGNNNAQFASDTLTTGGATMNLHSGEIYKGRGYSVGGATNKDGNPIPSTYEEPRHFTEDRVAAHKQRLLDEVGDNKDASIGSWLHEGKIHIDAADTVLSRAQAMGMAKDRNQIAIYDHKAGKDRTTWKRAVK